MRIAIPALMIFAGLVGGCATYPGDAPIVDGGSVAAEGSAVAMGQSVAAGPVVLTPIAIAEDSRCAVGTQCVWAGQVVVTTRIDGPGWRETKNLVVGLVDMTHGLAIGAVKVTPDKIAGTAIETGDYRIAYRVTDRLPILDAKGAASQ